MQIQSLTDNLLTIDSTIYKLLELSTSKQKVLIKRSHDELNTIIELEQKYLNNIFHLTKQQKHFINQLKEEYSIPSHINSLTEIVEIIGDRLHAETAKKILTPLKRIESNSNLLHKINEQNKMLIEASRTFIRNMIQAVRGSANSSIINRKM